MFAVSKALAAGEDMPMTAPMRMGDRTSPSTREASVPRNMTIEERATVDLDSEGRAACLASSLRCAPCRRVAVRAGSAACRLEGRGVGVVSKWRRLRGIGSISTAGICPV